LADLVNKEYNRQLTQAIIDKKPGRDKALKSLTNEVKEAVIRRYYTYCVMQN